MSLSLGLAGLAGCIGVAPPVFAQASAVGDIAGIVSGADTGLPVPNVHVTVDVNGVPRGVDTDGKAG